MNTNQGLKSGKETVSDDGRLVNLLLKAQKESKPLKSGKPRPPRSDAFAQFVKETQSPLARCVLHKVLGDQYLCEDMVQETYMKVWKDLARFDASKLGPTGVLGWLLKISCNTVISAGRRKRPIVGLEQAGSPADKEWTGFPEPASPELGPADQAHKNFIEAQVNKAVAELSEDKRAILEMHYLKGLSHKEIAAISELSTGSVNMKLFNARRDLRGKMEPLVKDRK